MKVKPVKTKPQTAIDKIMGSSGQFVGCTAGPSGSWSFHIWKTGAKKGDKCQCGKTTYKEL